MRSKFLRELERLERTDRRVFILMKAGVIWSSQQRGDKFTTAIERSYPGRDPHEMVTTRQVVASMRTLEETIAATWAWWWRLNISRGRVTSPTQVSAICDLNRLGIRVRAGSGAAQ